MWGEAQFDAFLRENPPTAEQEACLAAVAAQLGLAPMEHPWAYLRELQASFDPGSIKYTEEYYNVTGCPAAEPAEPDWKVFFGGGFWGGRGNGRAGTELRLETQFDWAGRHWVVPAAYACGKGLVVDVCMRAEADEIRRFLKTWDLSPENDSRDNFTPEQQLQIDLDNPLGMRPDPQLTLNGQPLQLSHGCTVCYNPCLPGSFRSPEAERMLRHYGLDARLRVDALPVLLFVGGQAPPEDPDSDAHDAAAAVPRARPAFQGPCARRFVHLPPPGQRDGLYAAGAGAGHRKRFRAGCSPRFTRRISPPCATRSPLRQARTSGSATAMWATGRWRSAHARMPMRRRRRAAPPASSSSAVRTGRPRSWPVPGRRAAAVSAPPRTLNRCRMTWNGV